MQKESSKPTLYDSIDQAESSPNLAARQRTLLAMRALRRHKEERPAPAIRRLPRETGPQSFPLSIAQEQLWLAEQIDQGGIAYHVPIGVRLIGRLDQGALRRCIAELGRRHDSLRTSLAVHDGQPVQIVWPPAATVDPRVVDLRDSRSKEREAAAIEHARKEAQEPFGDGARLFRATLLILGEEEHVILFTLHHLIADGSSIGVLIRDLAELYQAAMQGEDAQLPPLPVQYVDYAVWQRAHLQRDGLRAGQEFWADHLAGDLPVLELPRDRAKPDRRTGGGAEETLWLQGHLVRSLHTLGRQENATLFMVLLAAFYALLHRHSGHEDLLLSTPVANRNRQELEGLIGLFVNTLVLRSRPTAGTRFRAWIREVRDLVVSAFAHHEVPLSMVVQELNRPRDAEYATLTRAMFVHQVAAETTFNVPGLEIRPFPVALLAETLDFAWSVIELPDGARVQVQYSTDYYDCSTIHRLLEQYRALLTDIVSHPDRKLGALSLLSPADAAAAAAHVAHAPKSSYPPTGVHVWVARQARRTPGAAAIRFAGHDMSYRELNERANRLAHLLAARGIGLDDRVGLCMERSPEQMVAVLGIFKAGAACVPVDPEFPPERVRAMLEDSSLALLMGSGPAAALARELDLGPECWLDFDTVAGQLEEMPTTDPDRPVGLDHLAYVVFTSGSTGRPKAIGVPHRTLANLLSWQHGQPVFLRAARTLQFATLSFDASFHEIFSSWVTGGTLVLLTAAEQKDVSLWLARLRKERVERLFVPFIALQQLAEAVAAGAAEPPTLREVITAGEQLQATPTVRRFFERIPGCRMHNFYGPSETHVVSAYTLACSPHDWEALPPIGTAVANTGLHVLDDELNPVPEGVVGELYVAGDSLARGYLSGPARTAVRFLPDPFGREPGARLYRTGDFVRRRANGILDFLGRTDEQVKIRGYRVEPGEVEVVLLQHPAIRNVVVAARPDDTGTQRLIAYIVSPERLVVSELRRFVAQHLPSYMIPAVFVFVPGLPRLPNGKVDRRALPVPESGRPDLDHPYAPPGNPIERTLTEIWCHLLGVTPVGINDDFLELGGDSILGIRVVAQAYRAGIAITVRQLFEHRTIAALAAVARAASPAESPGTGSETVGESGRIVELPLSPMQQGILFHTLYTPDEGVYVEYVHCTFRSDFDKDAFSRAWRHLMERHPVLRSTFLWKGVDEPRRVVHPVAEPIIEFYDWRGWSPARARQELGAHLERADRRTFELESHPPMHLSTFQLEDASFDFVWTFHDLLLDGWSTATVLTEFRETYEAFRAGAEPALSPVAPYIRYLEWVQGQSGGATARYWERALDGLSAPTSLPLPRPVGANGSNAARYRRCSGLLSVEATERLRQTARAHGLTLHDVVQGAWAIVLSAYTGEEEVIFGSVISGRSVDLPGVDSMVGVLVNSIPVRTAVQSARSLPEWLRDLQREQRHARQHVTLPLSEIQRRCGLPTGASLFESIVDFVNYEDDDAPVWGERRWSTQRVGYPLFILVRPGRGLYIEATYQASLFCGEAVARIVGHFAVALESCGELLGRAAGPTPQVADVQLVSPAERERVVQAWNRRDAAYPGDMCIHELFEEQVEQTPEAVAVVYGGVEVTYGQLNRRANRLAHDLRALGVDPEVRVGLCMERSVELVVGLLGVLKAGGCCVPLDPGYPAGRIQRMIVDSGARMVLSRNGRVTGAEESGVHVIDQDLGSDVSADGPSTMRRSGVRAENLAYVFYTSGSTGRPKGVMMGHREVVQLAHRVDRIPIGPGDRVEIGRAHV